MKRLAFLVIICCLSELSFAQATFDLRLTNPMSVSSGQIEGDYSKIRLPMVVSQDGSPVLNLKPYTKELEKAAKSGDAAAMVEVGKCYLFGNGVEENSKKAQKWFEEAIELNNADALFWMGYMYEKGKAKKIVSASFFTKLGMERGAIRSLANEELEARNKAAESLYNKATIYNQPDAWFWRYCQARAKGESFNQALIAAAEGGNMKAQYEYGAYFLNQYKSSPATTSHLTTAKEWFSKAAEQGHPDAAKVVAGIEDAERQIEIAKREAQERARQEALEAARRDSIQRVQAEQQRRQDSIDIASGRKLPTINWLTSNCVERNDMTTDRGWGQPVIDKQTNSPMMGRFSSLCANDLLLFFGKDKLDDLDKALYKKSSEYQRDKSEFDRKRNGTYAVLVDLKNSNMKFSASGFTISSYVTGTVRENPIYPNYLRLPNFLFPVKPQIWVKEGELYKFACNDVDKLQQIRSSASDMALLLIFKPLLAGKVNSIPYSIADPVGLYLVNQTTGETILNLSSNIRKTNVQSEKAILARGERYEKAEEERNKPKYHKQAKEITCIFCGGKGYTEASQPERINGVWINKKYRCTNCYGRGYTMEHYY